MTIVLALAGFGIGIWLMVAGAEKLTDALLGAAIGLSVAPFVLGYVVSGIDLENLAVGAAAAVADRPGVSLGTIVGSATFILSFAVGLTAVLVPLDARVPPRLLLLTVLSPVPLALLGLDHELSRLDGAVLLALALAVIGYVARTAAHHPLFEPGRREDEEASRTARGGLRFTILVGLAALLAISIGAEAFNWSVGRLLDRLDLDETAFGMVAPARRGHATISVGNILGTVMFFFLFNAGVIALIQPLQLSDDVLRVHWPALMVVLAFTAIFLARGRIARAQGALLLSCYGAYAGLAAWRGITIPQ